MKNINGKWLTLALFACLLIAIATRLPVFTGDSTEQLLENPFLDSEILNFFVRKMVHIVSFGTVAVLFLLAFWKIKYRYFIGWFLATCYGAIDEWHQTFIPNRDGTVMDVFIDSTGAIIALICFYIYRNYRYKNETMV